MEIKIVPTAGNASNRSKYYTYFTEIFSKEDLEKLHQSIDQIKGNPLLGVMIDITGVKSFSERKNKISERGYITEDGKIKTYGTVAKALASFLSTNNIKGVYFVVREQEEKVYVTFKDLDVNKQKQVQRQGQVQDTNTDIHTHTRTDTE